jgi:flagellar protein FlgJ
MSPKEFVKQFYPFAKEMEKETGFNAIAILTQAALESGWGRYAPGNMFFGIKDTDGINGNEQLLVTIEYSRRSDLKFPVILSIEPCVRSGQKYFRYKVKDYFRRYDSPKDCFIDHVKFFLSNPRYAEAVRVRGSMYHFFDAIAKAGYATDPDYAKTLRAVSDTIVRALGIGIAN